MDSLQVITKTDSLQHALDSLQKHYKAVPAPQSDSLYIVLSIVIIVWTGIFLYLFNLDRRLKKLEKEEKE